MRLTTNTDWMNTIFKQKYNWSLIDPKPVFLYNAEFDQNLVIWNGMTMIYEHALLLASTKFFGVNVTPSMIASADDKFIRLYMLGMFDDIKTPGWPHVIGGGSPIYNYYLKKVMPHISTTLSSYSPADVWEWFTKVYHE